MDTLQFSKSFAFFKELEQNNDRDWFLAHKAEFDAAKAEADTFYNELLSELVRFDAIKDVKVYRIYRDIRFSKDKTPYKTHFGGIYKRIQPHNRGSLYVQIAPGDTFIGAGFFGPNKEDLLRIRKAIEMEDELEVILNEPALKESFGVLYGEKLKTAPKGFEKDHPRIDLLQYKQFLLVKKYTDQEAQAPSFKDQVVADYKLMLPFLEYMTEVLTTDENGESLF
jgi:TIGR02453 family protein